MPEPVVFISHFSIKEGELDALKDHAHAVSADIQASKPRTLVFLSYLDPDRHTVSFVHAFADADSMDRHIEGAGDRSRAAYAFIEPRGWEVYGTPSDEAREMLQRAAAAAGTSLTIQPEYLAGFLRFD
jgi:uncharacterized protein YbjT (DUF2867 family)